MFKTAGQPATPATMKQMVLIGSVVFLVGALILALALGYLHVPEGSAHAPRWVIGAVGLVFMLGGAAILAPLAIAGAADEDEQTPAQKKAIRRVQQVLGCLLLTAFASVLCWIGFGPGARAFSSSASFFGLTSSGPSSETSGRAIFGGMGVLVAAWAAFAWFSLLRTLLKTTGADSDAQPK